MNTAAFLRVEGPLVDRPAVQAAAWLAANAQGLSERIARLGGVALAAPLAFVGDRSVGFRLAWAALRGTSEDRLEVLGEEYWETRLRPRLLRLGVDLADRARAEAHRLVLVSDHPEPIARHLAAHFRADELVSNHLELRAGLATGRLVDPLAGRFGGPALRAWAEARGVALDRSIAWGTAEGDALLLSSVGRPCAVRPDRSLFRLSRDLDWPVLEA